MKINKTMEILIMADFLAINRFRKAMRAECNSQNAALALAARCVLPVQKSLTILNPLKSREGIVILAFHFVAANPQSRIPEIGGIYEQNR